MTVPTKPHAIEEIELGFESIGDPGWETAIRSRLLSYGVPLPQPMDSDEIGMIQKKIGLSIPKKLAKFYQLFGPLDLGYTQFLTAKEVTLGTSVWFRDSLTEEDRACLDDQLLIVDTGGSGNYLSFDLADKQCRYLCHDPASVLAAFVSFDHLIHWDLAGVFVDHYGWPDASVEKLVSTYQARFTSVL